MPSQLSHWSSLSCSGSPFRFFAYIFIMSRYDRRTDFKVLCTSGGEYYACGSGSGFVGCCETDPCTNGCGAGSLKSMSFDEHLYSEVFPDQECSSGSLWYTCAATNPPFMGCCKSNPCVQGQCPVQDLTAGFLTGNDKLAAPYLGNSSSLPSKAAATASSPSSTSKSSASPAAAKLSSNRKIPPSAIAGGIIGALVLAALLIAIVLIYRRRRKDAAPIELMPSESKGLMDKPLNDRDDIPEIHEAPGSDVIPGGFKDSSYPSMPFLPPPLTFCIVLNVALDSPYPTPTPVYSPHGPQGQSPPIYQPVSELESPPTPLPYSTSSHQSFELQSPDTSFLPRRPYTNRSTLSGDGLGITSVSSGPSAHTSTAYELSPSPLTQSAHAAGFSHEGNARPGEHEREGD